MSRYRRTSETFRHILMLLAIPLALMSTGYALFSQQLTISANGNKPAYSSSNNVIITYSKTYGTQGQKTVINFAVTVKNTGSSSITAWQAAFDVPTDYAQLSCANTVSCSTSGARVTVVNGSGNGTIAAGGTTAFTFSFNTASSDWILQNVAVAGTVTAVYQTISGLTVSTSAGTRTKSGKNYYWPYTFTVTNNSGSAISAWRIQAPWSSANTITNLSSTVNYVATTSQLTLLSTTGMTNSTTFQFTATLSSTSSAYTFTGYTIQGSY